MDPVHISLAGLSASLLLTTALIMNTPNNYQPLNERSVDTTTQPKLNKLNIFTKCVAFVQVAINAWFIYPIYEKIDAAATFYSTSFVWIVLFIVSRRLNLARNAYKAGHLSIFISIMFIIAIQTQQLLKTILPLPPIITVDLILISGQLLLELFLVLIYAFWNSRTEADDLENLSHEQGASIVSKLFFSWTTKLIAQGVKKPLEHKDLWELTDDDKSASVLEEYYAIRY